MNEKAPHQPMPDNSERDWTEDFAHENGNYSNKCIRCGLIFYGHKRRVVCKVCESGPKPTEPNVTQEALDALPQNETQELLNKVYEYLTYQRDVRLDRDPELIELIKRFENPLTHANH